MFKVLIYIPEDSIGHKGGPQGYLVPFLANRERFSFQLDFLPGRSCPETASAHARPSLKKRIRRFFARIWHWTVLGRIKTGWDYACSISKEGARCYAPVPLEQYDIVYFHTTVDFFLCRDSLSVYKGIIVLQSHSPKPPFLETIEDRVFPALESFGLWLGRRKLEKMDRYAFDHTDYVVFPCPEAEEPYINKWRYYREKRKEWSPKFRYLLTVNEPISMCEIKPYGLRKKLNIPDRAVIFCFAGRHVKAKGYDTLRKLGNAFRNRDDIHFVVCGNRAGVHSPNYSNWHEIGFTKEVYAIANESTFCLSLNHETYFDLSVLEYLALGNPMILANNGGNRRILEQFNGLVFGYDTFDELIETVHRIMEKRIPIVPKERILERYTKYYDVDVFLGGFEELIRSFALGGGKKQ